MFFHIVFCQVLNCSAYSVFLHDRSLLHEPLFPKKLSMLHELNMHKYVYFSSFFPFLLKYIFPNQNIFSTINVCKITGCCYSKSLRDNHLCVENSMRHHCPICYEVCFLCALFLYWCRFFFGCSNILWYFCSIFLTRLKTQL